MSPNVGIIVGFPDETKEEFDVTVGTALRWTSDPAIRAEISTAALRFYPGADLFGQANLLRYDPAAARSGTILPGFELRPEWRTLPRLFPLLCIHTPPEETRLNLAHRDFTRTLFKACPQTFRAAVEKGGLLPSTIYARMLEGRKLRFLDEVPDPDLVWNETIRAFSDVILATGDPILEELLAAEVPFFKTTPIVGPLEKIEHVIHPTRHDHAALLAYVQKKTEAPPPEVEGQHILSIRGGRECVVWFTKDPKPLVEAFEKSYAQDRQGTIEFILNRFKRS